MCSCRTALIMHMQKKRESCNVNHCAVNIATCTFEQTRWKRESAPTQYARNVTNDFLGEILEIHLDRVDRKCTRPYTQERVQFKCNFVEDTARWYSTQRNKLYKNAKILFSLCLSDYSENAHDCENPKKHWYQTSLSPKNKWRKSAKYTSFALQGRLFTSLWWLKTTLKKKGTKSGRTIQLFQNNLFR